MRKKSRVDVVWHRMKDMVKDEINVIVKESGGMHEATNEECFKYRTTAAKRVYLALSADERAKIDKETQEENVIAPPDVQKK